MKKKKPSAQVKALQRIAVALEKINNRADMVERVIFAVTQIFAPIQEDPQIKKVMKTVVKEMGRKKSKAYHKMTDGLSIRKIRK